MINNKGAIFIFFIIIISVVLVWVGYSTLGNPEVPEYSSQKEGDAWETFEDKDLGIELQYPPNWKVSKSDEDNLVVINIYPGNKTEEPIGIFDNRTHVSIYPKGVADPNIIGASSEVDLNLSIQSVGTEYSLENGDWWARLIRPSSTPKEWSDKGFVWAGRLVDGLSFKCIRDEEEVSVDECDETSGDIFYRSGTPSSIYDETLEKILSSIQISE